jgi:plasmid stabilization system protein ParE
LIRPLPIRVTRSAAGEISEAAAWWIRNRPAVSEALAEELERAFELIAVQPRLGAIAASSHLSGVRRVHLARIHYHLYYRVYSGAIEVLAFWHTSRGGPLRV